MTDNVYTDEVVADVVKTYNAVVDKDYDERTEVVKSLADKYKVSVASLRSKLVRENVYVAKEAAKSATSGKTKEDYVKALEAVSGETLTSFNKATKKDLEAFWGYVVKASARADADKVA
jgi:hypothetical protein